MRRNKNMMTHGMLMRPCAETLEQNANIMNGTKHSVHVNFLDAYNDHIAAMQIVSECAKVYIEKNWQAVRDWSFMNVIVYARYNKLETEFFNYIKVKTRRPSKRTTLDKLFDDLDKRDAAKHNPVVTIKDVVLDPTDGDLSMTINDTQYVWVDDESCVIIANYIEKYKNKQHDK